MFCFSGQSEVLTHSRYEKIVQNDSDNQCTAQKRKTREAENQGEQNPHQEREKENYRGRSLSQLHWRSFLDLLLYGALGVAGIAICYVLYSVETCIFPPIGSFFAYLLGPGYLGELLQGGSTTDVSLTLMSWVSLMYVVEGFRSMLSQLTAGHAETVVFVVVFGLWLLPLILLWSVWPFASLTKLGWSVAYFSVLWFLVYLRLW